MYDPSRLGVPIKNDTVVFLGMWHSYKIACTKIHERYADILFGPFFHALGPKLKFSPRPRFLSAIETVFVYLFVAYKDIRLPLKRITDGGGLTEHSLAIATNIRTLFEYFLPQVSHIYVFTCCGGLKSCCPFF